MPARLASLSRQGAVILPELPCSAGRVSDKRRSSSPSTAANVSYICDLNVAALPSRLAQQVRNLSRSTTQPSVQFRDILACAEALVPLCKANADPTQQVAALAARESLSHVVARLIAEMSFDDMMLVMPDLANPIQREELLQDVVCGGLRKSIMRSVQVCGNDACPGALDMRWADAQGFVKHLLSLAKHSALQQCVMDMAPYATRQVFDLVKISPLESLPSVLRRAIHMLQPWPAAAFGLTAVLRTWVPLRLEQLMARWAEVGDDALSPTLPSSSRSRGSPMRTGSSPAWKRTVWWLDVLRSASVGGLLESTRLVEFCNQLEPHLEEEGVKMASAQSVLGAVNSGRNMGSVGDSVSARLLGNELARHPAIVRYMPSVRLILLNCPGDEGSGSESILVSESLPANRHSTRPSTPASSARASSVPALRRR